MDEEIRIINRVIAGETDSFRLLVQRYQRPVLSMINNIVNDRHICEDIAQDVFFTAYRKLSSFDQARSSFSTWLFTIAKNKSINALRRKIPLAGGEFAEKGDFRKPEHNLAREEFYNELDRALNTLPHRLKTAFVLAEFEKLPYEQIAQIEGVRIGTIKSRINRAKNKLKTALKRYRGNCL